MNNHLRAQSRARLAAIEARLLELQGDLESGREREALDGICDLRGQLNVLFAALLVGHLCEATGEQEQSREFEVLIGQLLKASE